MGQLTLAAARRIAIAAQGLHKPRPERVTLRQLNGMYGRIGLTQIDSVNVLARAHLLPAFSRLGPYDTALYDRATGTTPPRLVEYWAHEAALVPTSTHHWLRARMAAYREQPRWSQFLHANADLVDSVQHLVAASGPMTARQVHDVLGIQRERKMKWSWNWSDAKKALETLFATGGLTAARRNAQFERIHDLPERLLGPLGSPPDPEEAALELVRIAARALGIATVTCLADYFRMSVATTKRAVDQLVLDGELEPVSVKSWTTNAFLHAQAARPRKSAARALLTPFDPMVFERKRLEGLFGMHYRLSIYTPADKREHGYYVLPFLLGEQMVARTCLKADRPIGTLLVRTAFAEPDAPSHTAVELADELRAMADWLQLTDLRIADDARGDLVAPLAQALRKRTP